MSVDLHIHTKASGDGQFSPQEIMELAKTNQLQAIAITDHDSVQSIEEAGYWGERYGVQVIPGCEFSSLYQGKWLHVLGYFIDYKKSDIMQWCDKLETRRRENVDIQIMKLREAGLYLDKDQVIASSSQPMPISYSRAIFLDHRNNNNPLVNQYRSQENHILKFCLDWIVTGKPYNAPLCIPDVQDVIGLIVKTGGVPVLAHPAVTLKREDDSLLQELIEMGIRGIEAFTTWHTKEQADYYYQLCQEKNLVVTCGSDFHGASKPHIHIGQVEHNSYEVVERLKSLQRLLKSSIF